jgi:hypothetical protein
MLEPRFMRFSVLAIACSAAVMAVPETGGWRAAHADEPAHTLTIDTLMVRFHAMPGLFAKFREEKRIALLAKPLVSEGTIHFAPPARLARHTLSPTVSSVVLQDGTVRYGDGTTDETVDLAAAPAVRGLVEGFLHVLAGDRTALERSFAMELTSAAADRWEIVLKPKNPELSRVIQSMTFAGDSVGVTRMRILEGSGDEGITTFSAVDAQRRYSADEIRRVFRLPGK